MMDGKLILAEYERLRDTDVRAVDPNDVADISEITINLELAPERRAAELVRRCGDILVKTSFAGTATLQSVLEECLEKR